jgi:Arc/MetJ-type ribon-helix-helix transcriptional regulator
MKTPNISVRISKNDLDAIDALVKLKLFKDRSEFLRMAVEQLLKHYTEYEHSLEEAIQ